MQDLDNLKPKFQLGQIVITPNALSTLEDCDIKKGLIRHVQGDWGECEPEDAAENEFSLREGLRLMSVYRSKTDDKFWIITESDRSVTTILLPEDY